MSKPPKPPKQKPSDFIGSGRTLKFGPAKPREVFLNWLLLLALLAGAWGFVHILGWFWFGLPTLLLGGGWLTVVIYADHLVEQSRYDQALRLVPFATLGSAGRSYLYLRGDVLKNAGRYAEAECMLRESINRAGGPITAAGVGAIAMVALGNVLMETGRLEEARCCFQLTAGTRMGASPSAAGTAEMLLRQGVFPQTALAHSERAIKLCQSGRGRIGGGARFGTIMATRAWALGVCGRGAEAQEAIDAALKTAARKTKGPLAEVHYKAGMSLLALSEHRGAEEHFVHGAELDPAGRWGRLCAEALRRQGQTAQMGE